MPYSLYELTCFFFIYSFMGWCAEVVYGAIGKRKFVNRGLLNGVLCPAYGIAVLFLIIFFESLFDDFIYLFIACFVVTTVTAFLTGNLLEKIFNRKFWDCSRYSFHIGNYVCLRYALIWALGAMFAVKVMHPFLTLGVRWLPRVVGNILLIICIVVLLVDLVTMAAAIHNYKIKNKQLRELAQGIQQVSYNLGKTITEKIHGRMTKAYPGFAQNEEDVELKQQVALAKKTIFAYGCSFHKLVWLFFLGAFLGDIIETIFCYYTMGRWMSRSSVVYGPFSIVWGIGIVFLTILLHRYRDKNDRFIFLIGTVLGGAYEYACSVFTEIAFGTVFWDYSGIPFNIGGRVNLLYCFFWGIAALIWVKGVYPFLSRWIERVPIKLGKLLSWFFVVFMIFNVIISSLALARYSIRSSGVKATNQVEVFLDEHFDDSRMNRIYPNAKMR